MNLPETEVEYFSKLQKSAILRRIPVVELALILLILSDIPRARAACDAITQKICRSSWEWIKHEDLLDSVLTILAVYTYTPSKIDGICLAYLANKMLVNEVEVGGPYYDNRRHVDIRTNVAVSRLFRVLGAPLANVDTYVSLHLAHVSRDPICHFLMSGPELSFSISEKKRIASTMPYVAKALSYKKKDSTSKFTLQNEIVRLASNEIKSLDTPLKSYAKMMLETVNNADAHDEIKMLPAYFAASLYARPRSLSHNMMTKLGMANLFTWMAYTIYDDFFDDEGQSKLLSVANASLRRALHIYFEISPKSLHVLVQFDKMDAANSWEISECRFEIKKGSILVKQLPEYGDYMVLADRAIGHVLGPLVVMDKLLVTPLQQNNIEKGLRYFLVAKQLSDDLADWTDDLKKGHISAVVSYMLKTMQVVPGSYSLSEITLRIQKYFWSRGLLEINQIILDHLQESKRLFKESRLMNMDGDFFLHIFNPLETSVRDNRLQAVHQKQFLTTYSRESIKE